MATTKEVQELFGRLDSKALAEHKGIQLSDICIHHKNHEVQYVTGRMTDRIFHMEDHIKVIWDNEGKAYLKDPFSDWKERYEDLDLHFELIDNIEDLVIKIQGGS